MSLRINKEIAMITKRIKLPYGISNDLFIAIHIGSLSNHFLVLPVIH